MSTITRTYTFTDGTTAYGSQVEAEISGIVTVFNNHDSGTSTWTQVKSSIFYAAAAGTVSAPVFARSSDSTTGMYFSNTSEISFAVGGLVGFTINSSQQGLHRTGTFAIPSISFAAETDCGMFIQGTNAIGFSTNGVEVFRWDASATATHTRFLVYDVDKSTLSRVTVGANDSGGTGFKVLRIPN